MFLGQGFSHPTNPPAAPRLKHAANRPMTQALLFIGGLAAGSQKGLPIATACNGYGRLRLGALNAGCADASIDAAPMPPAFFFTLAKNRRRLGRSTNSLSFLRQPHPFGDMIVAFGEGEVAASISRGFTTVVRSRPLRT